MVRPTTLRVLDEFQPFRIFFLNPLRHDSSSSLFLPPIKMMSQRTIIFCIDPSNVPAIHQEEAFPFFINPLWWISRVPSPLILEPTSSNNGPAFLPPLPFFRFFHENFLYGNFF